jgi:hypothetical protein
MHTARTTTHTLTAALGAPRLLAALALAAALVAIPVARPEDADARYMSERQASRLCAGVGGTLEYDFTWDPDFGFWEMTCTVPSSPGGSSFTCWGGDSLGIGSYMDCQPGTV